MKYTRKMLTAFVCTALFSGMLSALSVSAETPPVFRVADTIAVQKYLHGKQTFTKEEFNLYDINQDGIVNIYDWLSVKRYILNDRSYQESKLTNVRTDEIQAVRDNVWLMGMSENPVIVTSAKQFEQNMNSFFRPQVVRALSKIYDDDFFKEHDLVLDFQIQGIDNYQLSVSDFSMTDDTIHIEYSRNAVDDTTKKAILLSEFAIPKITHQYQFEVNVQGETALEYDYSSEFGHDYDGRYSHTDEMIDSYESYYNIWGYLPEKYQNYTKDFFNEHVLYRYLGRYQAEGSERHCYSVMKSGDTITIYTIQRNKVTDDLSAQSCDYIILNKSDIENAEIIVKNLETNSNFSPVDPSGQTFYYKVPYDAAGYEDPKHVAVNYDIFEGETQLTFYLIYSPSHIIRYEKWDEMRSIAYDGENPFSSEYETITDENGNTVFKGEKFEISVKSIKYLNPVGQVIEEAIEWKENVS